MIISKKKNFGRIKPKWKPQPNTIELRYREHVRGLPCLVCSRQATPHHIIHNGKTKMHKDHWILAPLCWDHHQGDKGYHGLGSHALFVETYGIDLHQVALELLEKYEGEKP